MMGLGVFPFLDMGDLQVQNFHCPLASNAAVSTNGGTALSYGDDSVIILGSSVRANGQEIGVGRTNVGGFQIEKVEYNSRRGSIEVYVPAIYATFRSSYKVKDAASTGYVQSLYMTLPEENTSLLQAGAMCTAETSNVFSKVATSDYIFDTESISTLTAACGDINAAPATETCGDPPNTDTVCNVVNVDVDEAREACNAGCSCGTPAAIESCALDYCAYGGGDDGSNAVLDCHEANPCSPPPSPPPPTPPSEGDSPTVPPTAPPGWPPLAPPLAPPEAALAD